MLKLENKIRVPVVDDSGLVRDMIRDILESDPGIVVVGEASNGVEAIAKVASLKPEKNHVKIKSESGMTMQKGFIKGGIVAIAASAGGPQSIHSILSHLPATYPIPIVISQHIAEGFTQGMVDWLNNGTPLTVTMAVNGALLASGHVYVNPAEQTMKISEQGIIILGNRDTSQLYNPSCNTLLSSVATSYRKAAIGLIMSGMGDDGVAGMQAIRNAGGTTLAQDAKSSMIFGMNRIAVERGYIHKVVPLDNIPDELMQLAGV